MANAHHAPAGFSDRVALGFTRLLRWAADTFFAKRYGHRAIVLETVAAVPGMVGAGSLRHPEFAYRQGAAHVSKRNQPSDLEARAPAGQCTAASSRDPQCFTAHAGGPDRRRLWPFVLDWPWHQALEQAASDAAGPACKRASRRPN